MYSEACGTQIAGESPALFHILCLPNVTIQEGGTECMRKENDANSNGTQRPYLRAVDCPPVKAIGDRRYRTAIATRATAAIHPSAIEEPQSRPSPRILSQRDIGTSNEDEQV